MGRLFRIPGVHFVNCQYGETAAELQEAQEQLGVTIQHWPEIDPLKNMDDFAALISALDLVISVDNSTVTWPAPWACRAGSRCPSSPTGAGCWSARTAPWYPTLRLFRQTQRGQWDDVFQRLAATLQAADGRTRYRRLIPVGSNKELR